MRQTNGQEKETDVERSYTHGCFKRGHVHYWQHLITSSISSLNIQPK